MLLLLRIRQRPLLHLLSLRDRYWKLLCLLLRGKLLHLLHLLLLLPMLRDLLPLLFLRRLALTRRRQALVLDGDLRRWKIAAVSFSSRPRRGFSSTSSVPLRQQPLDGADGDALASVRQDALADPPEIMEISYLFSPSKSRSKLQKVFIVWRGGPRSVMVTLLTLKQEVRGSNPSAAPSRFGAHTPPYYPASRSQRCVKGP